MWGGGLKRVQPSNRSPGPGSDVPPHEAPLSLRGRLLLRPPPGGLLWLPALGGIAGGSGVLAGPRQGTGLLRGPCIFPTAFFSHPQQLLDPGGA